MITLFGLVQLKKSSNMSPGFVSLNTPIYPFVMPYSIKFIPFFTCYKQNSPKSCSRDQFIASLWPAKSHTQSNPFIFGPPEFQMRCGASGQVKDSNYLL